MSSTLTNRAHLRKLINRPNYFCECFQDKVIQINKGYNDPKALGQMIDNALSKRTG